MRPLQCNRFSAYRCRPVVTCHAGRPNVNLLQQYRGLPEQQVSLDTNPFNYQAGYLGPVQLQRLPGCGRGLVAQQDIQAGQLLLACTPLALVRGEPGTVPSPSQLASVLVQAAGGDEPVQDTASQQQTRAFWALSDGRLAGAASADTAQPNQPGQLSPADEQHLMQLLLTAPCITTQPGRPARPAMAAAQQRVQVNAYGEVYQDVVIASQRSERFTSFLGVWPAMAMVNHACAPNATPLVVGDVMVVRAVKPIPAGDEVVISYAGKHAGSPVAVRRAALKSGFAFYCECDRCLVEQDYEGHPVGQAGQELYEQLDRRLKPALMSAVDKEDATAVAKVQSKLEAAITKYKAALQEVEDADDAAVLRAAVLPLALELLSLCYSSQLANSPLSGSRKSKAKASGFSKAIKDFSTASTLLRQTRAQRLECLDIIAPGSYAQVELACQAFIDAHSELGPQDPVSQAAHEACVHAHLIRYGPLTMDQLSACITAHSTNTLADDMAEAFVSKLKAENQ